ncbi:hypothetical protein PFX98_00015 [Paucibacter sediminis]|uniref:DUF4402 domain-containing protein n=1 Tax=Paucibacter sediminis TaxID=3019553 RepID=A0AA95SQG5_9BURK|nr:hypothetical protein [Paucibacter sp. S2-9]WIT12021.1 hypothetical protein PFX98_00015 [Paucibacter sp. S2-9]
MKLALSSAAALLAAFCSTSAFAGAATQTQIVNTVQQAVPVRDVSWQTWRLKGNSTLQAGAVAGDFMGTGNYTVPPGKRLVVEHVSLHCGMTGATPFMLQVAVAPLANYAGEYTTVAGPATDLGGGQYRGGAMVSVTADAGDVVFGRIVRGSYSYTGLCTQTLSGRLYDVQ